MAFKYFLPLCRLPFHFLLFLLLYRSTKSLISSCVCVCVQSCPTLFDPLNCNPPGSSVHKIFQARILGWLTIPSPGDLPYLGMEPMSFGSCIGGQVLYHNATWEALLVDIVLLINFWFCCLCFWCFIQKKKKKKTLPRLM